MRWKIQHIQTPSRDAALCSALLARVFRVLASFIPPCRKFPERDKGNHPQGDPQDDEGDAEDRRCLGGASAGEPGGMHRQCDCNDDHREPLAITAAGTTPGAERFSPKENFVYPHRRATVQKNRIGSMTARASMAARTASQTQAGG